MAFAAALSQHPLAADATGEVVGTVIERGGLAPDLVVTFTSGSHRGFLGEAEATVRTLLRPRHSIGCATGAVIGGGQDAEEGPALALFAAWLPAGAPATTFRPVVGTEAGRPGVGGIPPMPEDATVLVLADQTTFDAAGFLEAMARTRPDVTVVGGVRGGLGDVPGTAAVVAQGEVHSDGAVAVVLPPAPAVRAVVSQGCRPIGTPMVVTRSERSYVHELAGRPALDRLQELAESAGPEERPLLAGGVQLGIVLDEGAHDAGPGDFLVRDVLGADRQRGVLAVGGEVPVGATVQFHVRDATAARAELRQVLDDVSGDGALLFIGQDRGQALFGAPGHDTGIVGEALGIDAVAGMCCAGELGPARGRSRLHAGAVSMAVFADT